MEAGQSQMIGTSVKPSVKTSSDRAELISQKGGGLVTACEPALNLSSFPATCTIYHFGHTTPHFSQPSAIHITANSPTLVKVPLFAGRSNTAPISRTRTVNHIMTGRAASTRDWKVMTSDTPSSV